MKFFYALLSFALVGCATPVKKPEALRRLSNFKLQSKGFVPRLEAVQPQPPISTIALAYTNEFNWPSTLSTGLEATTNFTQWYEVARLPYASGTISITLSNRPGFEFYRAFNSVK